MTTTSQRLIIAVSSVLVGCAVGATMPRLAAQSFPSNSTAPLWEQVCDRVQADDDDGGGVNQRLALRGNEGFELVTAAYASPYTEMWVCFKRPASR